MINSRDINHLHPVVRLMCEEHIRLCAKEGINIILTSTLRDDEYQATLYAKGRTSGGGIVTNTSVTGAHGLGLAYDVVPVVNGVAIWDDHRMWDIVGRVGKSLGFVWGGDWKSFIDKPHFEMTTNLSFSDLRRGRRPFWFIGGYMFNSVLSYGSNGVNVRALQNILNKDGYGLTVDDNFGKATQAAVIDFQKRCGLIGDGRVGPATQSMLADLLKRPYRITWYGSPKRFIQVISFTKSSVLEMDVIDSVGKLETATKAFKRLNRKPTLLFNGSLFNTPNGASLAFFIDEGKNIGVGYYSPYGLKTDKSGKINITSDKSNAKDFIGFSPALVINGNLSTDRKDLDNNFIYGKHPRTAFVSSENEYHVVMVHGRRSLLGHKGMTIPELRDFCLGTLHAENAGNFDGGGSSIIIGIDGKPINKYLELRGLDNFVAFYLR